MRNGSILLLIPALALLAAADAGDGLRPGLWEESTRITGAMLAGVPAGMALPAPQIRRLCLPPDRDIASLLTAGGPGGCTADRVHAGAGHMTVSGVCQSRTGTTATTEATGSYAAEAYAMEVSTTMVQSLRPLVVHSRVTARRIGECEYPAATG